MANTNPEAERTITEERIMRARLPDWDQDAARICLIQIKNADTFSEETSNKRQSLENTSNWDYEDYNEQEQGKKPEGIDPKADVQVCGIGGCTVRVFQALNGEEIQTGECAAVDYCLEEKFNAVRIQPIVEEGQVLYRDIINTCERVRGGNRCPRLDCDLSAGVSEDQVAGTDGSCALQGLVKLEGFDPASQ